MKSKTCESCRYWDTYWRYGSAAVCHALSNADESDAQKPAGAAISTYVHDDTGLIVSLKTHRDFGCVRHTPVTEGGKDA